MVRRLLYRHKSSAQSFRTDQIVHVISSSDHRYQDRESIGDATKIVFSSGLWSRRLANDIGEKTNTLVCV